jgi:hypothetical protein
MSTSNDEKLASESQLALDPFDSIEDRKLVRKIDLRCENTASNGLIMNSFIVRLIPILTLLYLLSFLDRFEHNIPWAVLRLINSSQHQHRKCKVRVFRQENIVFNSSVQDSRSHNREHARSIVFLF